MIGDVFAGFDVIQVVITTVRKQNVTITDIKRVYFDCLYQTRISIYKTNYVTIINFIAVIT